MPDDRYSILFEPVTIGPKTAKNRFYYDIVYVYAGHQYARQLDNPVDLRYDFPRENYQPRSSN